MSNVRVLRSSIQAAIDIARGRMDKVALINHLEIAMSATHREKPLRKRASVRSEGMTDKKRREILRTVKRHPEWSLQEIATQCGVNIGRVSEVIHR